MCGLGHITPPPPPPFGGSLWEVLPERTPVSPTSEGNCHGGGGGMHKHPNLTFPLQLHCNERKIVFGGYRLLAQVTVPPPPPPGLFKGGSTECIALGGVANVMCMWRRVECCMPGCQPVTWSQVRPRGQEAPPGSRKEAEGGVLGAGMHWKRRWPRSGCRGRSEGRLEAGGKSVWRLLLVIIAVGVGSRGMQRTAGSVHERGDPTPSAGDGAGGGGGAMKKNAFF